MIYIRKNELNKILVTVSDVFVADNYTIEFRRAGENKSIEVTDTSEYKIRYNEFSFTEGTDITLDEGQGEYRVINNSDILVEKGVYEVISTTINTDITVKRPVESNEVLTLKRR